MKYGAFQLKERGILKALRPRKEIDMSVKYKQDLKRSEVERHQGRGGRAGQD